MKTVWTAGLDRDEKVEMKTDFERSVFLRRRAVQLLKERIKAKQSYARSQERFKDPNWDRMVAHSIGYEAALEEIISLFEEN